MKKIAIILAIAGLQSLTAFAASPAAKIGRAAEEVGAGMSGTREQIRPGNAGTGSKIIGTGNVVNEHSNVAAGTDAAKSAKTQTALTGVDSHLSCPANSALRLVSTRDQSSIIAATGAGLGGSACVENLDSAETVEAASALAQGGLDELRAQGLSDVSQASKGQVSGIVMAMARALAKKLETTVANAQSRIVDLCQNRCDITSPAVCAAAGGI